MTKLNLRLTDKFFKREALIRQLLEDTVFGLKEIFLVLKFGMKALGHGSGTSGIFNPLGREIV